MSLPTINLYEFGPFRLDARDGVLLRNKERVPLTPKVFETLRALVENSGRVVTKDELMQRVWPDTFVEEGNLTVNVFLLRKELGDGEGGMKYIETISKRGYRFVAPVRECPRTAEADEASALPVDVNPGGGMEPDRPAVLPAAPEQSEVELPVSGPADSAASEGRGPRRRGPALRWLAVGALGFSLAAGAGWLYRREHVVTAARPAIHSIAVLPFDNLSGDPGQDYFADGMTDELTTDLARISSLSVTSRTSAMQYQHSRLAVSQIRRELGVADIVEGSVVRSGNKVRVDAQLIDTSDDRHVWAQSFERNEKGVLALQDDVARAIANQVQAALDPALPTRLARHQPVNIQAYEAYLHGLYYLDHHSGDAQSFRQSLDYFNRAIALDPGFAQGYEGLARTYILMGDYSVLPDAEVNPKGEGAARHALALDDSLAAAHSSLAVVLWRYDWDWNGAGAEFVKALALDSSDSATHHWYGLFLATRGDFAGAEAQLKEARRLDPLSLIVRANLGWISYYQGNFPAAIAAYQDVLKVAPNFLPAHQKMWIAFALNGNWDQAQRELNNVLRLYGRGDLIRSAANAPPETLFRATAANCVNSNFFTSYETARLWAVLGKKEEAVQTLRKAESLHNGWMVYLAIEPAFKPLRSSPQFQRLLTGVGLSMPSSLLAKPLSQRPS